MKSMSNMSIASLAVMAILTVQYVFAQPPEIEWDRTYGENSSDLANSVCATSDGGYIFAGYTRSFTADSSDVYLVKIDSLGGVEWYRLLGGEDYDDAKSVQQTSDGGFILAGRTRSFGAGSNDMYVIRTNSQGDTLWTRTYGGTNSDAAESVRQTNDGGYIIAGDSRPIGSTLAEMYLVKTDSLGDTLWTRTFGGSDDRVAYSAQQTTDAGYIIAGCNPIYGGNEYDAYLVKTDSTGDMLWTRTYGGIDRDGAVSVLQTAGGGYIVTGYTRSFGAGDSDIWIINTDDNGDTLWTRTYGSEENEYSTSMQQTMDGGYVIAGGKGTYGGETDLFLIKIDSMGDTLWSLVYGGEDIDVGSSVDLTDVGGYIIAGSIWNLVLPTDAWLVKTGPDTSATHAPSIEWVSHPMDFALHPAYPNPFNPTTTISFNLPFQAKVSMNIYNILGQRVAVLMNGYAAPGIHRLLWDASDLPSGLYFVRMESGKSMQTQKVVMLK
jgi:hypothetical protein